MNTILTIIAVIAVVVIGFVIVKRVASCLWRIIVGVIVLAIFAWALQYLGLI